MVGRESLRLVGAWEWSDERDRRSSPGHVQFTEAQHLEQLPHVSGVGEGHFIES